MTTTDTLQALEAPSTAVRNLTVAAAVTTAGVGGVFYAFSAFVMSGLKRLPAPEGIAAMQSINVTAVRPPLMVALFGTAVLTTGLAVHAVVTWGDRRALLVVAGGVVYVVGTVVLTGGFHVPRNDALAALDPSAQAPPTSGPPTSRSGRRPTTCARSRGWAAQPC